MTMIRITVAAVVVKQVKPSNGLELTSLRPIFPVKFDGTVLGWPPKVGTFLALSSYVSAIYL